VAKISPIDIPRFEKWVLEYYADEFDEWELEASEWIELDEFIWRNYPEIIYKWREEQT